MDVVITGANGFIGSALAARLVAGGHVVTGLVRKVRGTAESLPSPIRLVNWGQNSPGEWREAIGNSDVVVNLAGASIGGRRWTSAHKRILRESRVATTRAVVDALRQAEPRAGRTLLSGSAVGYYGDGGDRIITENDPPGRGFLSDLCIEWETEALRAEDSGVRVVLLRTGIVLGDGGALERMLPPFRLGLGGPLGSGHQWMPWIHRDDAVSMIAWASDNSAVRGPLNLTSPNPVTSKEFARALGKVLGRPSALAVPAFALRLLLGQFAEALLAGQRAMPKAAQDKGFTWTYATLESALRDILDVRINRP